MTDYLQINSIYSVYTKNGTYSGKKVKVVAKLSYDEANKIPSNLNVILNNENFIVSDGDTLDYLKSITYYKCIDINTNEIIILFDDILDMEKTIRLNFEYLYDLAITITDISDEANITNVLNFLKTSIEEKYGNTVAITTTLQGDNSNTETLLSQYQNALVNGNQTLSALGILLPAITKLTSKLSNDEISSTLDDTKSIAEQILDVLNQVKATLI